MLQRQKIIAVAIAVPVIALIAYAASMEPSRKEKPSGPNATIAARNAPAKRIAPDVQRLKENARKALARLETMTEEEYAALRARRPRLPASFAEYKKEVTARAQTMLAMTQEELDAKHAARGNTRAKGKARAKGKGGPREDTAAEAPQRENAATENPQPENPQPEKAQGDKAR